MPQKKGNAVLLETIKAMGYEARTATTKDMNQEATKEVLVVKTRRRESSYSKSKLKKLDHHSKPSRNSNDENKGDWIPVGSNNKQNKRKDDMSQDGMSRYQVKTGVMEVRFMKISDK
jgi:hypothetical protein